MSSPPLFHRKPTTPAPPSPSPSQRPQAQAQAQEQAQQSTAPKSPRKKPLFPPPAQSSLPSPSPRNPRARTSDISLPSAITSATRIAATPLLPSSVLHSYSGNSNSNPGESSSCSPSSSKPATAPIAAAATRQVPDAPMFRAKPSSSSSPGSVGGGSGDAHERMWAEMQQKLQEVELSADHVFGSPHAKCLEELRAAQIALAQAWIRSEEEGEGGLDGEHVEFGRGAFGGGAGKGKGVAGAAAAGGGGDMSETETEGDILLARKRRLANDEHFARVARSVQDVTRRLEAVAEAMASVEMESRGIWAGGTESDGTSIR
ncbi:unnamed protein product [Tuber aestivum]|uniref:Uncharacterized protein n=1 Tax=Tuber aestivum TaxID=59557 RepID=A0A292Q7B0_9PEZI|nr:unnamed protein product [Tuber aestivum]